MGTCCAPRSGRREGFQKRTVAGDDGSTDAAHLVGVRGGDRIEGGGLLTVSSALLFGEAGSGFAFFDRVAAEQFIEAPSLRFVFGDRRPHRGDLVFKR